MERRLVRKSENVKNYPCGSIDVGYVAKRGSVTVDVEIANVQVEGQWKKG